MNDILLDMETLDLAIEDGDLLVGRSDEQHQEVLLIATKGDFKQSPDVGVDIFAFINEDEDELLVDEVRRQFTNDGMKVSRVTYEPDSGKLDYDASYSG